MRLRPTSGVALAALALVAAAVWMGGAAARTSGPATGAGIISPKLVCGALKLPGVDASLKALVTRVSGIQSKLLLSVIVGGATAGCPWLVSEGVKITNHILDERTPAAPATTPPLLFPPGQAVLLGSQIGQDEIFVKSYWTGIGANPLTYDVQQSVSGGAYTDLHMTPATANVAQFRVHTGVSNVFRVFARDANGLTSSWVYGRSFTAGIYDETNAQGVTYTGTWQRQARTGAHNGQVYWTERSGSTVTLRFTGSAVAWVGPRYQAGGVADVSIDGAFQTTVAQTGFNEREVLLSWVWPTPGTHTITVALDPSSAVGTSIAVDAFVVLS